MITPTQESLDLAIDICEKIDKLTFHLHYHILYDIARHIDPKGKRTLNYLEIGCYGGGSAILMLQRPKTNVVSIDLGGPIPMETAVKNVERLKKHDNFFKYIKGNSHDERVKNTAFNELRFIDILFIDGDHSYKGVIQDFKMYRDFVQDGGYIVFDDYADSQYSPSVRKAVDAIVDLRDDFEVIGQLKNDLQAPSMLQDNSLNNCFIIQCYR